MARPLTAAMTGLAKSLSRLAAKCCQLGRRSTSAAADATVCVVSLARFAAAENAPPASSPVSTTQRTSGSDSRSGNAVRSPSL